MKRLASIFAVCAIVLFVSGNVSAMNFDVLSGNAYLDSTLTGTGSGTAADPILIVETVYGPGSIDLQLSDIGIGNSAETGHAWGRWFKKVVTNATNANWSSFELELHEILGTPSSEGDGLSFAQGYSPRPFSSDVYTRWTEEILNKDYVNFFAPKPVTSVAPGETVTLWFIATDNSPTDPFYLRQNPNAPPVPEPASMLLLGSGLLGLVGYKKRNN